MKNESINSFLYNVPRQGLEKQLPHAAKVALTEKTGYLFGAIAGAFAYHASGDAAKALKIGALTKGAVGSLRAAVGLDNEIANEKFALQDMGYGPAKNYDF